MALARPLLPHARPAQEAATAGLIRANGQRVEKPSFAVGPGDILTLPRGRDVVAIRILALALRRGPAADARRLYEICGGNSA